MYQEIINFWFEEIDESSWWKKDDDFDQAITQRFSRIHLKASRCELFEWRENPEGRLAEIIVLDQFSRNIYRDSLLAFANDSLALTLAQEAVLVQADKALTPVQRSFFYMPFMHSESLADQQRCVALCKKAGLEQNLPFAIDHMRIIERFGRS